MDTYTVLLIMCVSVAGSSFLGHAIGYRRGEIAGKKKMKKAFIGATYGKYKDTDSLREAIDTHNDKIGL